MAKNKLESKSEQVLQAVDRAVTRSDDFRSLYANDVQVQITPWDIRIIVGEITGMPDQNAARAIAVLETAEIRMSPVLAKQVAAILDRQIRNYEASVGTIPVPGAQK